MARYSRDFLVPYLENICALHLAIRKIDQKIDSMEAVIEKYQNPCKILPPNEPEYESESVGCFGVFGIIMIAVSGIAMIDGINSQYGIESSLQSVLLVIFIIGVILLGATLKESKDSAARNCALRDQYEQDLEAYRKSLQNAEEENQRNLKMIPQIEREIDILDMEYEKAENNLELLYSVNIIPRRYREMYPAVYLYDWFSTGGSDDMDHALGMYVLEEIKSRLDRIIENQSEIILNQRIEIANQQHSIKAQNKHNQMMRQKLDRLQATEEERLRYDRMIEGNTAANAFFAAANYLK